MSRWAEVRVPSKRLQDEPNVKITVILLVTGFLAAVLWALLKLRELRERKAALEPSADKITVLLGLYMLLSKACIRYFRDRKHYPPVISGMPDGLVETGYLRGEKLAEITSSIPLFTIVVSDRAGHGICLERMPPRMAMEILARASQIGPALRFVNHKDGAFERLTPPLTDREIRLTLPLPLRPLDLPPEGME